MPPAMPNVCVLVPCYNEGQRLPQAQFRAFLSRSSSYDICFVNDGSQDDTLEVVGQLQSAFPDHVRVIDLQPNRGKADAVRAAMQQLHDEATYDWMGFLDADLAYSLEEMARFVEVIHQRPKLRFVAASRLRRLGANVYRPPMRHYFSRIIATWIDGVILKIGIYDSQCGAKLFRHEDIPHLFGEPFLSRWLFDIELFARQIIAYGPRQMRATSLEIPINAYNDPGDSRIGSSYMFKVPIELIRIGNRYRKRLRKARLADQAQAASE